MTLAHSVPSWATGAPTTTDLGTLPGDTLGAAEAINNDGTVISVSEGASGVLHAVRWSSRGAIRELPTRPGDTSSRPNAINDAGTIVGQSGAVATSPTAVRWDHDTAVTKLTAMPGFPVSGAFGINNHGVIVGFAINSANQAAAVRWNPDGPVTLLPPLPGDTFSQAVGINDGSIVGDPPPRSASVLTPYAGAATVRRSISGSCPATSGRCGSTTMARSSESVSPRAPEDAVIRLSLAISPACISIVHTRLRALQLTTLRTYSRTSPGKPRRSARRLRPTFVSFDDLDGVADRMCGCSSVITPTRHGLGHRVRGTCAVRAH
ncbi:hypothetical protein [Amycolatopsis sp. DG1A-15b]|uniref:hypothetical protein n=1 Tax=Amycolatopsis sp. DG1A-15b TaxID=3052846 RepID=UPI00255C0B6B|nr:hypothetical protein [Amycolatopsis sp. DG1A-15b]WIX90409.1 hypothetical protein QRY02_08270 [Amycolatopsis sp. DG1A-15b]